VSFIDVLQLGSISYAVPTANLITTWKTLTRAIKFAHRPGSLPIPVIGSRVFVSWNENQQEKTKSLVFTGGFSTEREAELEGSKLARKWIDDGEAGTTGRTHMTRRLAR
jgi:hypothetical protein